MMTEQEHLLTLLAEEAGELVQACSKALRFGLDDGYPGTERTNAGDILTELAHVKAVECLLGIRGLPGHPSEGRIMDAKIAKVREFMEYARKRGTLKPNDSITGG